jgi:hypothetical protein
VLAAPRDRWGRRRGRSCTLARPQLSAPPAPRPRPGSSPPREGPSRSESLRCRGRWLFRGGPVAPSRFPACCVPKSRGDRLRVANDRNQEARRDAEHGTPSKLSPHEPAPATLPEWVRRRSCAAWRGRTRRALRWANGPANRVAAPTASARPAGPLRERTSEGRKRPARAFPFGDPCNRLDVFGVDRKHGPGQPRARNSDHGSQPEPQQRIGCVKQDVVHVVRKRTSAKPRVLEPEQGQGERIPRVSRARGLGPRSQEPDPTMPVESSTIRMQVSSQTKPARSTGV